MWQSKTMNLKHAFSVFKEIVPLVPVFGNWKKTTAVYALLEYGAPRAMTYLQDKRQELQKRNSAE